MPERVGFPCAHALGTLLLKSNTNLQYSVLREPENSSKPKVWNGPGQQCAEGFPQWRPTVLESTNLAEKCPLHLTVLLTAT